MFTIRTVLDEKLSHLDNNLLKIGSLSETAVEEAMSALSRYDVAAAQRVAAGDAHINALFYEIKQDCLLILATQNPTASDLRRVLAVLSIATDLERIGDHAAGIARLIDRFDQDVPVYTLHQLPKMANRARKMMRQSLQAFINRDIERAHKVIKRDDKLDRQYETFANLLMDEMNQSDQHTQVILPTYLLWIGHKLERIGDHVTNIAEQVIFVVTGAINPTEQ